MVFNFCQTGAKNAFLHGNLKEEMYIDITPSFSCQKTQSKVLIKKGYDSFRIQQNNADHTMFSKHSNDKIVILIVYVDEMTRRKYPIETVSG